MRTRTIKAGDLRHPVTLLKPNRTVNEKGRPIVTYADVIEVYAKMQDVGEKDFYAAQAAGAADTVTFTVRWREEITADWRIRHHGQASEILEINHLGYRGDYMRLKCRRIGGG